MAQGNCRQYLQTDTVRVKKYFYVLRPIFACMWIERYNSRPPMEFSVMFQKLDLNPTLKREVENPVSKKKIWRRIRQRKTNKCDKHFSG